MRVLVIGKFYTEGFALHIAETLCVMGHDVSRFEPGMRLRSAVSRMGHRINQVRSVIHTSTDGIPQVRRSRMQALWDVVEETKPDVVIVCHDFLWPEEVARLKRAGAGAVAMWFPDAIVNFGRGYFMNADYDGLFFKDPFIVHQLGDVLRSPVYYLPEGFNPEKHVLRDASAEALRPYECDIATAGNQHSWRVAYFSHLSEYHVRMWGAPPPLWMANQRTSSMYQGRGVFDQEKALAFCGAKIVLNNLHYGEIWGVNVRCFEAAGVGAFQFVDWRPALSHLFDDGREIISFRSVADLKHKIAHWLPRDAERKVIAAAGQRRAINEHTYRHRLELLLDTIAGRARGFAVHALQSSALPDTV